MGESAVLLAHTDSRKKHFSGLPCRRCRPPGSSGFPSGLSDVFKTGFADFLVLGNWSELARRIEIAFGNTSFWIDYLHYRSQTYDTSNSYCLWTCKQSLVKSSTCRYSCRVIEWPDASRRPSVREEVPAACFSQALQHDEGIWKNEYESNIYFNDLPLAGLLLLRVQLADF